MFLFKVGLGVILSWFPLVIFKYLFGKVGKGRKNKMKKISIKKVFAK